MRDTRKKADELRRRYDAEIGAFVGVCRRLGEKGYVVSTGGNLAWRLGDGLLLVTPTRMYKGDVTAGDVVFVDLDGRVVAGSRKPTGELPMYLAFFRERPDVASVVHAHPPMTCAFAISPAARWLCRPVLPETVIEVGPVPLVPYAEPLTQQLADNFQPLLKRYNAFLMQNHGLVVMSPADIRSTMMLVELVEATAASLQAALAIGEVREIPRDEVADLERTRAARELPLPGAPGVNRSLVELYAGEPAA